MDQHQLVYWPLARHSWIIHHDVVVVGICQMEALLASLTSTHFRDCAPWRDGAIRQPTPIVVLSSTAGCTVYGLHCTHAMCTCCNVHKCTVYVLHRVPSALCTHALCTDWTVHGLYVNWDEGTNAGLSTLYWDDIASSDMYGVHFLGIIRIPNICSITYAWIEHIRVAGLWATNHSYFWLFLQVSSLLGVGRWSTVSIC